MFGHAELEFREYRTCAQIRSRNCQDSIKRANFHILDDGSLVEMEAQDVMSQRPRPHIAITFHCETAFVKFLFRSAWLEAGRFFPSVRRNPERQITLIMRRSLGAT
jgi:hypothetical protein